MTMKYQNPPVNNRHLHKLAIQAGEGSGGKESPTLICSSAQGWYNGQFECSEKKKNYQGEQSLDLNSHTRPKSQETAETKTHTHQETLLRHHTHSQETQPAESPLED